VASGFGRVTDEDTNDFRKTVTATGTVAGTAAGTAAGARSVTATLQNEVAAKPLEYVGPTDSAGGWVLPLNLKPGDYTLRANALTMANAAVAPDVRHYCVQRSATLDHVTSVLDDEGKTTERRYAGSGKVQSLNWDALGRLTRVSERDGEGGNGYDWSAIYDGLGRRLRTETRHYRATVPFPNGTQIGDTCTEDSWFDPLHEFLEIGLEVTWSDKDSHTITSHTRSWKIHGVDANGEYGGLQGVGGLEAVVDEESGTWTALVDDYHGHIIGSIATANTVQWSLKQCSGFGPAPGSPVFVVAEGASLVQATAWRGQRLDVTG
jgi:hypothetical protein